VKVVAFCDSIDRLPEFRRRFDSCGKHQLAFVVCNNARRPAWLYLAFQLRHGLRNYRFRDWGALLRDLAYGRLCLAFGPLGVPKTIAFLKRIQPDLALHAMGVIYRKNIIDLCGLGILNAHIGRLPRYRGRSVMEWSILCGDLTGVTVFFIDTGIDTGSRIVHWEPVPLAQFQSIEEAKHHLFSKDVELYYNAIQKISDRNPLAVNDTDQGVRFYEMSSLFRAVLQTYLESDAFSRDMRMASANG